MENLIFFVAGALVSAVIAFFISKRVSASRASRAKMEAESLYVAETARLTSDLAHSKEKAEDLNRELIESRKNAELMVSKAKAEWDETQKKAMDAMQSRFDETVAKMQAQLNNTTAEMLKARQEEFSKTSKESIGQYIDSVKQEMEKMKKAVEEGDKNLAERSGEMRQQIQDLMSHSEAARKSADELATALKKGSKVQGDWGEMKLAELLKSQGLTEGIHFDTQTTMRDEGGKTVKSDDGKELRPDVILHLDERREVIIDSKVSISSFIDYVNAETEDAKQAALKAHLVSIQKHVSDLSKKDYSAYVKSPKVSAGYVIMFVPNSGALWTALNADTTLWRKAADANVLICDEQSLYGALKVVSMTWTQIAQVQNHEKVFALADEVVKRIGMFQANFKAIGDALNTASGQYEDGLKKLYTGQQSITGAAKSLIDLGAKASTKYPIKPLLDVADIPALED